MSAVKEIGSITKSYQLQATVTKTADFAGTEVDLGKSVESAIVILDDHTNDMTTGDETYQFTLKHCDTSGGTFTAVTGGTFTLIDTPDTSGWEAISIPESSNLKRYVKLDLDVSGTTPSITYSASIVVAKRGSLPPA